MPSIQNAKSTLDFLDTIGTNDRGDDVRMNNTGKALVALAEFLITTASDNMDKKGNVATGNTISSMKIINLDLKTVKMSLEIEILGTYKFLDQGVKGVGGVGRGKYQFKNLYVSRKMATAILKWVRRRGIRAGNYPKKYGAHGTGLQHGGKGKIEQKDIKINQQVNSTNNFKSLAYAVSRSIKKNGIKPTFFFSNAIKATQKEQKKILADGLRIDIINSLNSN